MTRQLRIASLAAMLACLLLAATVKAVVSLTTPATITAVAVTATSLNCRIPISDTTPVQCYITFAYTDAAGNPVAGFQPGQIGPLDAAGIIALIATPPSGPNNYRNRVQQALITDGADAGIAGSVN